MFVSKPFRFAAEAACAFIYFLACLRSFKYISTARRTNSVIGAPVSSARVMRAFH